MTRGPAALLLLAMGSCPIMAAEPAAFAWPDGQRAAVSLAYDDALDSQLDMAIPALDRRGLKGSFYLTMSSDTVRTRMDDWRAAARSGHELGNHSLFHQCAASKPERTWVTPQHDLDAMTVAQMQEQVRLASTMLQAIDGATSRTFTVPCGDTQAHDGDYVAGLAADFVGIKVMGGAVVPDMHTLDAHAVPVEAPVGLDGDALVALVEDAARRGTMVNLTFHGIGAEHLAVSSEAHAQLLDHLAAHRDRFWTATFREIMTWVRDRQAAAGAQPHRALDAP
ncbi:polysaccharide deacetylase family protein [Luteimonas fraxinea]|uniref:Polysaccharide deacetylase family protein n=1 Tax=Luteimonas fraxinea TaxID=2901869 RepID=A0ABS8U7Q9_9GAMM|nr:polysaccharide deacetylase family protein [Luteimonas fraxinea]MCD9095670.1 polysaccharide deacetylase family protein [Luteimonas fraxinea]UHH11138.1 polysaccharide deacetylase family protein [Luteimonas fraxinea]